MSKLQPCPICGGELKVHGPEDWKPTYSDPDSGGDPYSASCDCGFYYSNGSYDYTEFVLCCNRRAQQENRPLTLEELREMDGEPLKHWVWVKVLLPETWPYEMDSGYYRNILDFSDGEAFCCGYPGWITGLPYSDYGKTWVAYRSKPKEEHYENY